MQWSCPHCGAILAVADDALGTGWSFSRCYKCGGFALIRRAEINIIKVDKAPPGEKILLPEASTDPTVNMMNNEATQKAAKYFTKEFNRDALQENIQETSRELKIQASQPAQTPALRPTQAPTPPPFQRSIPVISGVQTQTQIPPSFDISGSSIPEPLPEIEQKNSKSYIIPIGITSAAILMVVSGTFLYIQGQALWQKAREASREAAREATHVSQEDLSVNAPVAVQAQATVPAPTLLMAEPSAQEKPALVASRAFPRSELTDQVQKSAMAPEKESVKEAIRTANTTPEKIDSKFMVRVRPNRANLRSGPGLNFPIIGTAIPAGRYQVTDLNNGWFKLFVQKSAGAQAMNQPGGQQVGWIRNELVQVLAPSARD